MISQNVEGCVLIKNDVYDDERGLFFYNHPDKSEFSDKKIKSIYLGYYHWWDGRKHYDLVKDYGFIPRRNGPLSGNILDYDNIDEKFMRIILRRTEINRDI